jgi:hypothetical protein
MINDQLALTGALTIKVNNDVVQETKNLVVTAGKNWVADRMKGDNDPIGWMAIGTGTTAAAAGDTTLGTELDRNALSTSGGTVSGNTITFEATWAAGDGTGAITEAGLFDAASSGDMLARTVFAVVNKAALDSMTITWTITVS